MDIIKELTDFITKNVGIQGTGVILFALLLVYVWYQHHRYKLLEEKMELIELRRAAAAADLERLSHSANVQPPRPATQQIGAPILVADDETMVRLVLTKVLEKYLKTGKQESKVVAVDDGQDALDFLKHKTPRLLILDLMMPRMTGYEVLRELAGRKEHFPILVFSGYATNKEDVAIHGQISPERIEFLQKPASTDAIVAAVKNLIERHEQSKAGSGKSKV